MEILLLLSGIILTLVQVLKVTFKITARYIPIVSVSLMAVVLLGGWVYLGYPKIPLETIIRDFVAVLTAMGLWSGVKATIGK